MNNTQFAFACVSAVAALLGASWIIAQSMARTRSAVESFQERMVTAIVSAVDAVGQAKRVPEYDARLQEGERRMGEFSHHIEGVRGESLETQKELAVHSQSINNLKQRFEGLSDVLAALREKIDEMPEKIVRLLRGMEGFK